MSEPEHSWDGHNRRIISPWVLAERVSAIVGAVLAVSAVLGVFFVNPFMMAKAGQEADTLLNVRVSGLESRFDAFERNQNLQLEVTMQERIERLNVKREQHPDDPDIVQQRLLAIQACQEVKAKLGRPNTRCF